MELEFICCLCKNELFFSDKLNIESHASLSCCSRCGLTYHQACLSRRKGGCPKCEKWKKNLINLNLSRRPVKGIKSTLANASPSLKGKIPQLKNYILNSLDHAVANFPDDTVNQKAERSFEDPTNDGKYICVVADICTTIKKMERLIRTLTRFVTFVCLQCKESLFSWDDENSSTTTKALAEGAFFCHTLCGHVFHANTARFSSCMCHFDRCPVCQQLVSKESKLFLFFSTAAVNSFEEVPAALKDKKVLVKKYVLSLREILKIDWCDGAGARRTLNRRRTAVQDVLKAAVEQAESFGRKLSRVKVPKRSNASDNEPTNSKKNPKKLKKPDSKTKNKKNKNLKDQASRIMNLRSGREIAKDQTSHMMKPRVAKDQN